MPSTAIKFAGLQSAIRVAVAALAMVSLTPSAQATYDFWGNGEAAGSAYGQLVTDPGTYGTFVLGENISFNACSATFAGYSLCDLPDLSKFVIEWAVERRGSQGAYQWVGGQYSQASATMMNVTLTANQQSQSVFGSTGTFYIGLHIATHSNVYIPLPGGGYAYTGNGTQDPGWIWTSQTLAATAPVPPSPVPEPLAVLMLAPMLGFVAIQQRRRRRKQAVL